MTGLDSHDSRCKAALYALPMALANTPSVGSCVEAARARLRRFSGAAEERGVQGPFMDGREEDHEFGGGGTSRTSRSWGLERRLHGEYDAPHNRMRNQRRRSGPVLASGSVLPSQTHTKARCSGNRPVRLATAPIARAVHRSPRTSWFSRTVCLFLPNNSPRFGKIAVPASYAGAFPHSLPQSRRPHSSCPERLKQ